MDWLLLIEIIYTLIVIAVCIHIIYETNNTAKTMAYILFAIFVPIAGIIFYFSFGINYRKRKMYSKKLIQNDILLEQLKDQISQYSKLNFEQRGQDFKDNRELVYMLVKDTMSALTKGNQLELLINGEKKFPQVLRDLEAAKHHIHIQYYIYEDDKIGQTIENILIRKANEGVKVRFIYDDFGSHAITKKMVKRLKAGNVEVFPFQKIKFILFANRINHRNHRKIIVIDGQLAYVGGINVSDKYINPEEKSDKLYWRDTHLRIFGPGTHYLQYLFLCDWNFCAKTQLQPNLEFFPYSPSSVGPGEKMVQIAAGGPDSDSPTVLYTLLEAVSIAREELLITTPYYIPDESIQQSLIMAGLGGIRVKLLVPGVSDSALVNAAARAYYGDLLKAGVEIYLYQRGFVHAKTMVVDRKFAIVGTANMDYRSFDLNFEVNAIVYDEPFAKELADVFMYDLQFAEKIDASTWFNRPGYHQLFEKVAKLVGPLL